MMTGFIVCLKQTRESKSTITPVNPQARESKKPIFLNPKG